MHLYIWIKSWGGWEEVLFPAAQYFPIFVFVIFRRVGNFDVRRDSNVHRDTLVRSWLSLTDRQTNVRLENFSKLNWTKHSRGDITFSACNCTYFKALLFKFWLEGKNNSLSALLSGSGWWIPIIARRLQFGEECFFANLGTHTMLDLYTCKQKDIKDMQHTFTL